MTPVKKNALIVLLAFLLLPLAGNAKGKWDSVVSTSPRYNKGVLLLLSDGTVLAKTSGGGRDVYGSGWDRLTPDIHGSYINGIWTRAASMADTRLYFSTQVLKNGMVYAAGGEYGSGRSRGEVYDPQFDFWTPVHAGLPLITDTISDANSEILPDGKVLQAVVLSKKTVSKSTYIYDPVTDIYTPGPPTLGIANESVWLKLQDNSILFVDINTTNAERYIPAMNKWISDSNVTVPLYDVYGSETGAAMLLPDGRAFFIGSTGNTAYYTPSGDTTAGSWATGPHIPDTMGAPDAAAAMMVNGKILCSFSHIPTLDSVFHKPMSFYEFDYKTNVFTRLTAPNGEDSSFTPAYFSNMLCLPNGSILYGPQGDDQYYTYTPDSPPLAEGKPTLSTVATVHCDTFMATGMLFNGITEGASYGDDWQMNTNYPLIRLVSSTGDTVMYMQTLNWNSTGVRRGTQADTTLFVFPINVTMPEGSFSVQVVVNGNASELMPFDVCAKMGVNESPKLNHAINVYPNPADKVATVEFEMIHGGTYNVKLENVLGRVVKEMTIQGNAGKNTCNMQLGGVATGVYTITVQTGSEVNNTKLMVK